jgi:hypothetical protein
LLREGSAEPDRLTCDRTFQQVASTVDLRLERHFCPIEFAGSLEALSRGIYARGIWQLNATAERATMNRMKDRNSYICESRQHWYAPKPNGDSAFDPLRALKPQSGQDWRAQTRAKSRDGSELPRLRSATPCRFGYRGYFDIDGARWPAGEFNAAKHQNPANEADRKDGWATRGVTLRRQDSNLNSQNQNLMCCRLHHDGSLGASDQLAGRSSPFPWRL